MTTPLERILEQNRADRTKKTAAKKKLVKQRVKREHWGLNVGELEEQALAEQEEPQTGVDDAPLAISFQDLLDG